jgi:hypothetical protein
MERDLTDVSFSELLDEYAEQEKIYALEGARGIRNFTELTRAIGYNSLDDFLADNSGAIEAMVNWLHDRNVPEWKESLASQIHTKDD